MTPGANIQEAADRLRRAWQSGVPCAPIKDSLVGIGPLAACLRLRRCRLEEPPEIHASLPIRLRSYPAPTANASGARTGSTLIHKR